MDFSLVPNDYKSKDPRILAYLYPDEITKSQQNLVKYNKTVAKFIYYNSLKIAEEMAKMFDYLLIPSSCVHWRRAKELGKNRRIKVGRNIFYLMREDELTKKEKQKLIDYVIHHSVGSELETYPS